jgi:uncharacterized DUF497 family protein
VINSSPFYAVGRGMDLKLRQILWLETFRDKIVGKHGVEESEVEEVLFASPHVRFAEKGHVKGEHVYVAYGQAESGRYLVIFFIDKGHGVALPISARDMSPAERSYYNGQNEAT